MKGISDENLIEQKERGNKNDDDLIEHVVVNLLIPSNGSRLLEGMALNSVLVVMLHFDFDAKGIDSETSLFNLVVHWIPSPNGFRSCSGEDSCVDTYENQGLFSPKPGYQEEWVHFNLTVIGRGLPRMQIREDPTDFFSRVRVG
jgi:hypothetical protein